MIFQQINKPYYNEEFRTCDFSINLLADTIQSSSIIIRDSLGVDKSSEMISDIVVTAGTGGADRAVRYCLKGGNVNETYLLEIRITTASTQKMQESYQVCVY